MVQNRRVLQNEWFQLIDGSSSTWLHFGLRSSYAFVSNAADEQLLIKTRVHDMVIWNTSDLYFCVCRLLEAFIITHVICNVMFDSAVVIQKSVVHLLTFGKLAVFL